jgi:hypothetical protein
LLDTSGHSLFEALDKIRLTLERKNRRDVAKMAYMKEEEEEEKEKVNMGGESKGGE